MWRGNGRGHNIDKWTMNPDNGIYSVHTLLCFVAVLPISFRVTSLACASEATLKDMGMCH